MNKTCVTVGVALQTFFGNIIGIFDRNITTIIMHSSTLVLPVRKLLLLLVLHCSFVSGSLLQGCVASSGQHVSRRSNEFLCGGTKEGC